VAADPALREALSGLSSTLLVRRCTQLEVDTPWDTTSAAAYTLRLLARRTLTLTDEIRELEQQITTAVTNHTPQLLTRCGVGPDNAAAFTHRRWRQPRPAAQRGLLRRPVRRQSPGSILRQNPPSPPQPRRQPTSQFRALPHRPIPAALGHPYPRLPRPPHHRRQNPREAIRCLKRYIAREIYRIITSPPETQLSAA
jgi:transposase